MQRPTSSRAVYSGTIRQVGGATELFFMNGFTMRVIALRIERRQPERHIGKRCQQTQDDPGIGFDFGYFFHSASRFEFVRIAYLGYALIQSTRASKRS